METSNFWTVQDVSAPLGTARGQNIAFVLFDTMQYITQCRMFTFSVWSSQSVSNDSLHCETTQLSAGSKYKSATTSHYCWPEL